MSTPARADNSILGRWWWTVDRATLSAIFMLIGFGYVLVLAASPAVATRIGASRDMFIFKQVVFLALAGTIVIGTSMLSVRNVRRLALAGCLLALVATAFTLVHGMEIKGARRWIALPFMSVQPSEFLKPCFAVTTAWLLTEGRRAPGMARQIFPGHLAAFAVLALIVLLLKSQPDIGMLSVILCVFLVQLFIDGLPLILVGVGIGSLGGAFAFAFMVFPHVRSRVERFLHPQKGDHYQIDTALAAFSHGGLTGRGPGEGRVKDLLPDAHADFVFAVAGEEFGMILCLVIILTFMFIVVRSLLKQLGNDETFTPLAVTGLCAGFGLQAFVNMASSLHLIPTKGMTLPFISYGGSSAMSVALTVGMLLALTRRRVRS
jgi:cell division protein FtsW